MLHRSFKPAKCKTSLKLATSRMKLMKNKKGVQLNQMKRDLAQLLESGQDQTARIRVEHVIREEKMMGAYELIELYCELIAARLPIIESQKSCPIDLKEAITSVVFASPRCSDIPELQDIRKHLTAKYGKEFITAAVEMRPNCGVSRMLVEKLSAVAPDGPTKIKVLTAIAEEHNIKWEPKAFGEKDPKPPEDLLNGPSTFEKASKIFDEAPKSQVPPNERQKHDEPLNFSEQNMRSSLGSQSFASTDIGGIRTSTTSHSDARRSEMGSERMEVRQSNPRDGNTSSFGGTNWNTEFTDATSAAQAAAESAERASMAARAAVELSNQERINRQYSSETQRSNIHNLRKERSGNYAASNFTDHDSMNQPPRDENTNVARQAYGNTNSTRQSFPESHQSNSRGSGDEIPGHYSASNMTGQYPDTVDHSSHHRNSKFTKQSSSEPQRSNVRGSRDERPHNHASSNLTHQHSDAMGYSSHGRNAHVTRQSSTESQKSKDHGLRDEIPGQYAASKSTGQHRASNSYDRNPNLQNEPIDENEFDNMGRNKRSSRSASLRSNKDSIVDDETVVQTIRKEERYSRKGSFEEDVIEAERGPLTKPSMSRETPVEFVGARRDEDMDYFGEGKIEKQFSTSSFRSHSSTSSDNYNVLNSNHLKFGNDAVEDLFVGNTHSEAVKSNISDDDAQAFDESNSDGGVSRFDIRSEYDEVVSASFFPSPDRDPTTHPLPNTEAWSPRRNMNNLPEISTTQTRFPPLWLDPLAKSGSSKSVDPYVNVDDLDGPKFDSEDELEKPMPIERKGSSSRTQNVFALIPEPTHDENHELSGSLLLDSKEVHAKKNQGKDSGESPLYNPVDEENHIQTFRGSVVPDVLDTPESPSDSESGKELNFGMLRGGLRHKGNKLHMYPKSASADATVKNSANDVRSSYSSRVGRNVDETPRAGVPTAPSESDSDSSVEELLVKKAQGNKKPSLRIPVTHFGSDSGESEEDLPKQSVTNRNRLGSGLSRRTKASPSNSKPTSSYSSHRVGSKSSDIGQSTTRPQTGGLSQRGSLEQKLRLEKRADSKPMPKPETPLREESPKGPREEEPSSPLRKTDSAEYPKDSSLSSTGETSTGDKTTKNAPHVHPKLPDFDKVFAHLQAMRSDRK